MAVRELSLLEIWRKGLEALYRELGPVGMVRFMQQYETGHGDYTAERRQWLGEKSVRQAVEEFRRTKRG